MSGISGINSSMLLGANAMTVHSVGMQVAAHNIANVNTDAFNPQRAIYATGANGNGVALQAVIRDKMPLAEEAPDAAFEGKEFVQPSGTELAKEIPHMIITQRTFEANAATVRVADEMLGTLLSVKA